MDSDQPLFRPLEEDSDDQEEVQPPTKKQKQDEVSIKSNDENKVIIEPMEVVMISDDSDEEEQVSRAGPIPRTRLVEKSAWQYHYFGEFIVQGFTLWKKSAFCSLKNGEAITLIRPKPDPSAKQKEDTIVRFTNKKGQEVGRIAEVDASYISKLMDGNFVRFTGVCVDVEKDFNGGADVILSLTPEISRTAFDFVPLIIKAPTTNSKGIRAVIDETKETVSEKLLRERKTSLNKLFDKTSLQPVAIGSSKAVGGGANGKKGKSVKSKRNLVEKLDAAAILAAKNNVEGEGDEEVEEGEEINLNQLNMVYSKAIKNDANLPEMEPADTFALDLRGYQKQALKWMHSMEGGGKNTARENLSMNSLWEEYVFPIKRGDLENDEAFYYNPYSGELSLEFPHNSQSCRGGILADEQGLGKTIMIAALIHSSVTPVEVDSLVKPDSTLDDSDIEIDSPPPPPTSSSSKSKSKAKADEGEDDSDDELEEEDVLVPSTSKPKPTQSHLKASATGTLSTIKSKNISTDDGSCGATLIVAPMTLLSQWTEELKRCSKDGMNVLLYYGTNRKSIQEEIEGGVKVVVTSYGTLCSDFKNSGRATPASSGNAKGKGKEAVDTKGKGKAKEEKKSRPKKKDTGLYSVEWFRVVLDEAHLIKSRNTQNAKSCYALRANRRWCLSGTPIVNKLEDLYSLLHFIQLEPWGNFSFFRAFVTAPFEKKDPKAIEAIQGVLESVLLRREKSMKDRNGEPIVALPTKHLKVEYLNFSDEERIIYDALYRNAKSQFLGFEKEGSVLKNVTAIFSILMRLRQAVLHPQLVLSRLSANLAAKKKLKNRTLEEKAEDREEESVLKLLSGYGGKVVGGKKDEGTEAKLEELLEEDLEIELAKDCGICFEPAESPVTLAKCLHFFCNDCVTAHLAECEENNQEPRCSTCNVGPINSKDILEGIHTVHPSNKSKSQKNYTSSTSASSPSSSASGMTETLTIMDSSEDETDKKKKKSKAKAKGKGKAKMVTSESESESHQEQYVPKLSHFRMKDLEDADNDDSDEDEKSGPVLKNPTSIKSGGLGFKKLEDFKSSTKLNALKDALIEVREKEPLIKAIVFSQFTGFLDIIERMMNKEGFNYVRLDGSMSQRSREKVVTYFTKTKSSCILLASLKAGGVGLNLIAATRVYLLDCWWNEAIEKQAIDRIHRFGQTREVYVTRFLVTPSIDDKMIQIQERKTRIINGALGAQSGKNQKQLSDDLALIFAD